MKKTYKTFKLNSVARAILMDVIRRINLSHKRDVSYHSHLSSHLLGLGYPSEFKNARGIMRVSFSNETPRVLNWYTPTDNGKSIIKQIIRKNGTRNCMNKNIVIPSSVKILVKE